jgi:ketosteroid isomerase-like protein
MLARVSQLFLAGLILVPACAPPAATPPGATQADSAAINALRDQEVAAIGAGDTAFAYMADDIVLMPPNEPAVVGIPAARAWFGAMLQQFRASATYTSSHVVFGGDLAVEHYTGTVTLTPVAGGEAMTEVFKGLHVYRRDAAGAWKMVQDIWNMDAAAGS